MTKPLRVLFVCKANIGRSQALREFTQQYVKRDPILARRIVVDSAGTSDTIQEEIKDPAKRSIPPSLRELYARVYGIEHGMPARKRITNALVSETDLVLVAEPRLKAELHARFPGQVDKIKTAKEYLWPLAGVKSQVIDDPPHPTSRRYLKATHRARNFKMLRECYGISRRLVEKWKRELTGFG